MSSFVGGLFLVVGVIMAIFARHFARLGLSFYFSEQDLASSSGPRSYHVRLALAAVSTANVVAGLVGIYIGDKLLS